MRDRKKCVSVADSIISPVFKFVYLAIIMKKRNFQRSYLCHNLTIQHNVKTQHDNTFILSLVVVFVDGAGWGREAERGASGTERMTGRGLSVGSVELKLYNNQIISVRLM